MLDISHNPLLCYPSIIDNSAYHTYPCHIRELHEEERLGIVLCATAKGKMAMHLYYSSFE